jgi:PhoPQ-activated pathogenicity-related protein
VALFATLATALPRAVPAPQPATARAQSGLTALDRYVAAPDPNFTWKVVGELPAEGATATLVEMTSQQWLTDKEVERPLWTHWITIVRPTAAAPKPPGGDGGQITSDFGLLFIGGGSNERPAPARPPAWLVDVARETGTVTAELRLIPNQPVIFKDDPSRKPRSEDDFIAYTWDKFLRTGDEKWPARLPMTKSAVRAMDAVTAFTATPEGGGKPVTRFVVSGASKRGWTTWTTAATDRRVIAIAPAVIDMLNVEPSFIHHWRAYGAWSDAVDDYVQHGIMDWMGTPEFRALMKIEEPYEYRDRLTMPKFMLNASGDQFFLPDSSRFYFDDLRGEKYLRYVPNTSHSLDKSDALESLQAFYSTIVKGTARPQFTWTFEDDGSIKVVAKDRPEEVLLWQAVNPTARNFRHDVIGAAYTSTPLTPSGPNTYVARVAASRAEAKGEGGASRAEAKGEGGASRAEAKGEGGASRAEAKGEGGWTAFFVELKFPSGGKYPLKFTTAVRVFPDTLPFGPPPRRTPARGASARLVEASGEGGPPKLGKPANAKGVE